MPDTERSVAQQKSTSVDGIGTGGCQCQEVCTDGTGDTDLIVRSISATFTRIGSSVNDHIDIAFPRVDLPRFHAPAVPVLLCPCPSGLCAA